MSSPPRVSIVLPTYNRARFLPDALASIESQHLQDWELVIVDDGSTDETAQLVTAWRSGVRQTVTYVHQSNLGAYAARNRGLDEARGDYVAFFDSDDLWLPHHIEECARALDQHADLDWVFAACRVVTLDGALVSPTTFEVNGQPRPFLSLRTRVAGNVHLIADDRALEYHLRHGFYCGLQNSVIRRGVFDLERFWEDYRVVDDTLFLARVLARGSHLGYLKDVHVVYRVHEDNSSGSATGLTQHGLQQICEEQVRGLERLAREVSLTRRQKAAWRQGLAQQCFWRLGYVCYWQAGASRAALTAMRRALRLTPLNLRMWKTYAACFIRSWLFRARIPAG